MELPTAPHHLPGRMHAQQHASILAFAFLACTACRAPAGPAQDGTAQAGISDSTKVAEEEVKAMVDSFLVAIGNYDLVTVRPLFAPHANIGGVFPSLHPQLIEKVSPHRGGSYRGVRLRVAMRRL
ncbi:MAG: hypothetical protein KDB97_08095 [Flavobacteriales bacterium]|nr:hypothetical protein [Flavobacteriales bacterium]